MFISTENKWSPYKNSKTPRDAYFGLDILCCNLGWTAVSSHPRMAAWRSKCKTASRGTFCITKTTQVTNTKENEAKRRIPCCGEGVQDGDPSHSPPPPPQWRLLVSGKLAGFQIRRQILPPNPQAEVLGMVSRTSIVNHKNFLNIEFFSPISSNP